MRFLILKGGFRKFKRNKEVFCNDLVLVLILAVFSALSEDTESLEALGMILIFQGVQFDKN